VIGQTLGVPAPLVRGLPPHWRVIATLEHRAQQLARERQRRREADAQKKAARKRRR
jgi:hypothetical protein